MIIIKDISYIGIPTLVNIGLSYNTIKQGIQRKSKQWQAIKSPEDRRVTLIRVDTLAPKYRNLLKPIEEKPVNLINEDIKFFRSADVKYTDTDIKGLCRSVALAREALKVTTVKKSRALGFDKVSDYLMNVIRIAQNEGLPYPRCTEVDSYRRFLKRFKKAGLSVFINKKLNNNNRAKLHEVAKDIIFNWYASPLKPTYTKVTELYNDLASRKGWSKVSESPIKRYLNIPEIKDAWFLKRHGEKAYQQFRQMLCNRELPSYADALWTLDGTKLMLLKDDKKSLYIFYVCDVRSGKVLSYEVGLTENSTMVERCLKNAMKQTGNKPFQLQYDGGSSMIANSSQDMMNKMSHVHFACAPYQPQGKMAESFISKIEKVMHSLPNFLGSNIPSSSLDGKANPQFLKSQMKDKQIPNENKVLAQVELVVKTYNNSKIKINGESKTRNEWYAVENENREKIGYDETVSLFMTKRKDGVKYNQKGIDLKIRGEHHYYWVKDTNDMSDLDFRREWQGQKFDIYMDIDNKEVIYLYVGERFVSIAKRKDRLKMAVADMEEKDMGAVRSFNNQRKDYMKSLKMEADNAKETAKVNGIGELSFQDLNKDAMNEFDHEFLMEEIFGESQQKATNTKSIDSEKKHKTIYGDDDCEMKAVGVE